MSGAYKYGRIRPSAAKLASLPRLHAASAVAQLPAPPAALDFGSPAFYSGMLGNDGAGNCTWAGAYGLIQGFSAATNPASPIVATTAEAIAGYSAMTGYNPQTGANDTGCVETDVLDLWVKSGLSVANPGKYDGVNVLKTYATVDPRNIDHIKQAIWACGGVYLGLEIPESAQGQTERGEPWSPAWWSPIEGGHCVVSMKYDANYLYVRTWGHEQAVTWGFVERYFDAAYALVNPLWIGQAGKSPDGLDIDSIVADLPCVSN